MQKYKGGICGYICKECGITLKSRINFQAHMMQVHQQCMSHVCSLCGRCYRSNRGLQYHMQTHYGTKYNCPICYSEFSRMGTVKRHLRTVHRTNQCPICRKFMNIGPEYNQHLLECSPNL